MDWEDLRTILTKSITVLAWPPFSLLCPLYVSIRAMETDSRSSNKRCLAFWVLFSLSMIMEWELAVLLKWLPWWPHVKAIATILLLIPYFGAVPFAYKFFIKHYCTWNIYTKTFNIFSQKSTHFESDEHSKTLFQDQDSTLVEVFGQTIITSQIQEEELVVYQGRDDLAGSDKTESSYTRLTGKNQVQKEWSCALCQITTTSENCLGAHLQGNKHKAKEEELRLELPVTNSTYLLSSAQKKIKGMILLKNLNQIANILSPVSRSVRWCEWTKPESGWTKLNTDGSIHRETAGFGGLLRDYRGEPICAFVSKAPQGDVFLVELWAIWRGLVLSLGLGIKSIWVESDSMSVVKTINKKQPSCPKADSSLKQIWKLLNKFDKYKISHSWRETNRAADHLAKMVIPGNDVVLWPVDFPHSLCNIIKDDARGKKYLRR
ncbi:Zinc finger C2H2 superfamily [Sesbania bispinosa]|nr:Zinc finger C2H2 superfamily [Sesbania bispinosa]